MKPKTLALLALALCSYLPAAEYLSSVTPPMEPQTELEQLTVIIAKYGNNPDDTQAINYAILMQDEVAIDLLLKYGAMPGQSSLEYARRSGSLDMLKRVVATGVSLDSYQVNKLIYYSISDHQNDIARYVIEKALQVGQYMPHSASEHLTQCARVGNVEIYNLLISKGLKKHNQHFLFSLLSGTHDQRFESKKLEMVAYFLNHNMLDLNPIGDDPKNYPVLFMAAAPHGGKCALGTLKMLLEHGANANIVSSGYNVFQGESQLLNNSINESDEQFNVRKEMIQLLVDYGADINHKDRDGNTPLKHAYGTRLIEFLKSLGAE